jgi:DNA polymerase III delta prime subunit
MSNIQNDFVWVEKYRPKKIEDFVLSPDVKSKIEGYITKGNFGNLIFYGHYGTGKTSLVRFLLSHFDAEYESINASEERGIDVIREKVKKFAQTMGFGSKKVFVFNEGEKLTKDAQESLKEIIEESYKVCTFIFVTNNISKLDDGIVSRCDAIHVRPNEVKDVANYVWKNIIKKEKIEAIPADVLTICNRYFPDIRRIVNNLQTASLGGTLDIKSKHYVSSDEYSELVSIISKTKKSTSVEDWKKCRKIILSLNYEQQIEIYTYLFDNIENMIKHDRILEASIMIGVSAKSVHDTVDNEIHVSSLIAELINLQTD